ncbi:MAG: glycosyltransferase family 4 protein [Saprospiraceae bacterium]|nr:glycosyltransferase family 4 protein [Saprospiraceae bacterium]
MKILFILENYFPHIGGLEKLFKHLAEGLAEHGHQVTIITNKNESELPFKEHHGTITILRYRFINRYFFTLFAFFPAFMKAFSHDVIHTTSYNAALPAYFAAFLTRKKILVTFHEVWDKLWLSLPFFSRIVLHLHYYFERFLLRLPFDRFVAVSDYTMSRLLAAGVDSNRVIKIYNGIDYTKYQGIKAHDDSKVKQAPFCFLYFGRLGISKGLDILIPAIKILSQRTQDFQVILIIPRKPRRILAQLMKIIERNEVGSQLEILHELPERDLIDKIMASDSIIIPSYSEGFCYTAVESMALAKPIISSQQGALKEVVSGPHLSFTDQDPTNLAQAMFTAMEGNWIHTPIKTFPLTTTVENYIQLYKKLTQS